MKKLIIYGLIALSFASTAQQKPTCTALTTAGNPCKSTILMQDNKCRVHSDLTPRCGAMTSKGKPCKIAVKKEGIKCKHHSLDK